MGIRSITNFDSQKLIFDVDLKDERSCATNFCPSKEKDVTYFRDNTSPQVFVRLDYSLPLTQCVDLRLKEVVEYKAQYSPNKLCFETNYVLEHPSFQLNSNYDRPLKIYQTIPVFKNLKHGGRAKLQLIDNNTDIVIKEFNFLIKGINPKIGEIMKYIDKYYTSLWMIKHIAMHETGLYSNGFTAASDYAHHFRRFATSSVQNYMKRDYNNDWTHAYEMPLCTFDCGYGNMQRTDPSTTVEEIWNWNKNIEAVADEILDDKRSKVKTKFNQQFQIVEIWDIDNDDNKVDKSDITYAGHTWNFSLPDHFKNYQASNLSDLKSYFNGKSEKNKFSLLDAGLILYYNGNGGTPFIEAVPNSTGKPVWKLNDAGYGNVKYILEVMSCTIPKY